MGNSRLIQRQGAGLVCAVDRDTQDEERVRECRMSNHLRQCKQSVAEERQETRGKSFKESWEG